MAKLIASGQHDRCRSGQDARRPSENGQWDKADLLRADVHGLSLLSWTKALARSTDRLNGTSKTWRLRIATSTSALDRQRPSATKHAAIASNEAMGRS